MPAFTFEKISSREQRSSRPAHPSQGQGKPTPPPRRDNVIQVLGRFVIARVRETPQAEQVPSQQPLPK